MKRLTTEEVIEQFKKIHGEKYDYSKVKYVSTHTPVTIICPQHGEFEQAPSGHKSGRGCPKCAGKKLLTVNEVIEQFKAIHGERYDYSKVKYVNTDTKVTIICPIHGEFEQTPSHHKEGVGCPKCAGNQQLTTKEVIKQFKEIHGKRYDYSKVKYVNNSTPVTIICSEHGEFEQTPSNHKKGEGCPYCGGNQQLTAEEIIEQFKAVHGDKYDYSKVEYINTKTPVTIICPVHGEFKQTPDNHKRGKGCMACSGSKKLTTKEVIEQFREIHGEKYDYSKVSYVDSHTPVTIICPEHGEFTQAPTDHKSGKGCPVCGGHYRPTTEEIVEQFIAVHGDRYDYSKVVYIEMKVPVIIICPKHGEFLQAPVNHKRGADCPRCVGNQLLTTKEVIKQFKEIHGEKYDYSKVKYVNSHTKVTIICPEHGEFEQTPANHKKGEACPSCVEGGFGFDPSLPAILYYVSIKKGRAYKIGITNRTIKERFSSSDFKKITVIKKWPFQIGRDAYNAEQAILREFSDVKWDGESLLESGNTELFKYDVLGLDVSVEFSSEDISS